MWGKNAPIFDDFFESGNLETDLTGLTKEKAFMLGKELGRAEEHLNCAFASMPKSRGETLIISARNLEALIGWAKTGGVFGKINRQINDDLYMIDFTMK